MIPDDVLLALCVYEEARGEPDDGKAAVARVVLNRKANHYSSDGTMRGTVLSPNQFSWAYFDMVGGQYQRVCRTVDDAEARAATLLTTAERNTTVWADCAHVADLVRLGQYAGGPDFMRLTGDVVLYLNPAVISKLPAWADPAKFVCRIGHHDFYRAGVSASAAPSIPISELT